ncbi:MAG: membrane dipeptidase [Chitinophagaceae bacterium]|nr:membrane dipeptidase [Chitinophagaceae bacterium]MCW5926936.1 membrane dipeptidase [Chitinophagaceae bacterium]
MFIVDAHLDISMNAMEWNRDFRKPVADIRDREKNLKDKSDRGLGTVCFPELRRGNIGLIVATQIARYVAPDNPLPGWHSPEQAWAQTQAQLAWYRAMEAEGELRMIRNREELQQHLDYWESDVSVKKTIGYILSLEGADSLITLDHLHTAYNYGLRAVGPAHYGPGRYANGTDAVGNLNADGVALIKEMDQLGMILDTTHLCDDAFWDALEIFKGPVWASHNNCRKLVDHNRQFSDEMIRALVERGAVIGCALDAWMIVPGWVRGKSNPLEMQCNLERAADHVDHICQLAGNTMHVGIGSDLDGAFGKEQSPYDLDTVADLQKFGGILSARGYTQEDISRFMHGNWLRIMKKALPAK